MIGKEIKKDQTYVSSLPEYIQNKVGHTSSSSNLSPEQTQDQEKKSTRVSLLKS